MITGQDIVCLSTQDWNDLWTRKQRFMQRFARQGNRVLYIEAPMTWASLGFLRADWRRPFRWLGGPRQVEPNLYVATPPLLLPFFQMFRIINNLNIACLSPLLRRWIRTLGFHRPILWTYLPHTEGLVGRLGDRLAIYDCVDELSSAQGLVRPEVIRELEGRLIRQARLVIVTHENLYRSKGTLAQEIALVPNGAEVNHFRKASLPETRIPAEMQAMPRPIVGFVGLIQYWIDLDLLRFLALARPNWSFVLVGPRGRLAPVERIEGLPNVHLLGRKRYEDLPGYLKAFDVCLNPYVVDDTALHCSPLKLYEYLAAGKPVVSVDMPEARKFDGVVRIGRDYEDILRLVQETVDAKSEADGLVAARIRAVEPHSWDHRFQLLESVLEKSLEPRSG